MKRNGLAAVGMIVVAMLVGGQAGGCGASTPKRTGFLSDYSNLTEASSTSFRYIGPRQTTRAYTSFMIDPVTMLAYEADKPNPSIGELGGYFETTLTEALEPEYPVVTEPGPGVARIRIAITNAKASKWFLRLHPVGMLAGAGMGEAAMEAEFVDSVTGEQVAALVEAQRGRRLELDAFSKYDDARDAIDDWCKRIRERLDEIHTNAD
ncbi:MAG: DUF3313 domain-containing protein [Phycisphaerales bacterium JB040]